MAKNDRLTPGTAAYYKALTNAGIRLEQNSSGGTDAVRTVRDGDGTPREITTKDVKQGMVFGDNGKLTPALNAADGSSIVVETGPGTTGWMSQFEGVKNEGKSIYLSPTVDPSALPELPEELVYEIDRNQTGEISLIRVMTKEKRENERAKYEKFCQEYGLR